MLTMSPTGIKLCPSPITIWLSTTDVSYKVVTVSTPPIHWHFVRYLFRSCTYRLTSSFLFVTLFCSCTFIVWRAISLPFVLLGVTSSFDEQLRYLFFARVPSSLDGQLRLLPLFVHVPSSFGELPISFFIFCSRTFFVWRTTQHILNSCTFVIWRATKLC